MRCAVISGALRLSLLPSSGKNRRLRCTTDAVAQGSISALPTTRPCIVLLPIAAKNWGDTAYMSTKMGRGPAATQAKHCFARVHRPVSVLPNERPNRPSPTVGRPVRTLFYPPSFVLAPDCVFLVRTGAGQKLAARAGNEGGRHLVFPRLQA